MDGLLVAAGIGHNQKTGLTELLGDLVGEGSGGVAAGNGLATSVLAELQNSTLRVLTSTDHDHILRILNSNDDTGSEHHLLPGLGEIDNMHSLLVAAEHVVLHHEVQVLGSAVGTSNQHLTDVVITRPLHLSPSSLRGFIVSHNE